MCQSVAFNTELSSVAFGVNLFVLEAIIFYDIL